MESSVHILRKRPTYALHSKIHLISIFLKTKWSTQPLVKQLCKESCNLEIELISDLEKSITHIHFPMAMHIHPIRICSQLELFLSTDYCTRAIQSCELCTPIAFPRIYAKVIKSKAMYFCSQFCGYQQVYSVKWAGKNKSLSKMYCPKLHLYVVK